MKVVRVARRFLSGFDGSELAVEYDNLGEPYREGIRISLAAADPRDDGRSALLSGRDALELRKHLDAFLGTDLGGHTAPLHDRVLTAVDKLMAIGDRLGSLRDSFPGHELSENLEVIGEEISSISSLLLAVKDGAGTKG